MERSGYVQKCYAECLGIEVKTVGKEEGVEVSLLLKQHWIMSCKWKPLKNCLSTYRKLKLRNSATLSSCQTQTDS